MSSPVVHVGATLVLVDTQKDAYEMDYDAVARAITPKTKAIILLMLQVYLAIMIDYLRPL